MNHDPLDNREPNQQQPAPGEAPYFTPQQPVPRTEIPPRPQTSAIPPAAPARPVSQAAWPGGPADGMPRQTAPINNTPATGGGSPAQPTMPVYGAPPQPASGPSSMNMGGPGGSMGGPSGNIGGPGGPPVYGAPTAAQPAPFAPPPAGRRKKRPRPLRTLLGVVAIITMLGICVVCFTLTGVTTTFSSLLSPQPYYTNPPSNTFSVVQVVGDIANYGNDPYSTYAPSYCHSDTVAHIKLLAGDDNNKGILLYMNTPGGGVYESDEVYLALMDYKEATGRPVWAYMADMCASGGYYIAAAADTIIANRNTTTGSIGVYIAMSDTSGLYDKLGIETVLVRSGANKGTGMSGVPITNEQRAVYQSIVDETYEQFIGLVADGRDMDLEEVRTLADGRVYTGAQALDLGLVDELGNWDDTLAAFKEETGASDFWPSFNQQVGLARLIGSLSAALPVGDAEAALREAERTKTGVPMALYHSP